MYAYIRRFLRGHSVYCQRAAASFPGVRSLVFHSSPSSPSQRLVVFPVPFPIAIRYFRPLTVRSRCCDFLKISACFLRKHKKIRRITSQFPQLPIMSVRSRFSPITCLRSPAAHRQFFGNLTNQKHRKTAHERFQIFLSRALLIP